MEDPIRNLALEDGRYSPEAFRFLFESLEVAIRLSGKEEAEGPERHVTGREVLDGMIAHAREIFGPLAEPVWLSWGIRESIDWGHIVFLLVDAGLLNRQESDRLEDFDRPIDLHAEFVAGYEPELPDEV
jgi:uncharacterized repeat protein (TIGR04138 family)